MTKKSLTPSQARPAEAKIDKLCDRVRAAARKSGIPDDRFQLGLEVPGTGLEDDILKVLTSYIRKASSLVVPSRAQDTGLVPEGWAVWSDEVENDVCLAQLDFCYSPCAWNEEYIYHDAMLERVKAAKTLGSLGLAKIILDEQKAGRQIIPVKLQGKKTILFPKTIIVHAGGDHCLASMPWYEGKWYLEFIWLDNSFNSSMVVPREHQ